MNRLKLHLDEYEEQPPADEFFVLYGEFGSFYVTRETASRIESLLDGPSLPRWLIFNDLSGSRIRVRSRQLNGLYESTASQRTRSASSSARANSRTRPMHGRGRTIRQSMCRNHHSSGNTSSVMTGAHEADPYGDFIRSDGAHRAQRR